MSKDVRSSTIFFSQLEVVDHRETSILWQELKEYSACICLLTHTSHMPKQRKTRVEESRFCSISLTVQE